MPVKARYFIGRLGLVVTGIVFALLALEGFSRILLFLQEQKSNSQDENSPRFFQSDPDLEWKHIPFAEERNSNSEFNVFVQINGQGFHDRDYSIEKPLRVFRILLLGDSFAEGMQVEMEQTMQYLLESNLNQRAKELGYDSIEVINGGTSGYGPGHELLFYKKVGRQYKPDLVLVLTFVGNDFEDENPTLAQRTFASGISRNKFFKLENGKPVLYNAPLISTSPTSSRDMMGIDPNASFASRVDFLLLSYSKFYLLIRPIILESPIFRTPLVWAKVISEPVPISSKYSRQPFSPAYKESSEILVALLGEIGNVVKADGISFGVVVIPEKTQVHQELVTEKYSIFGDINQYYDFEKPNRTITTYCQSENIKYLDLLHPLRQHVIETNDILYYLKEGHWNPKGNQVAANEISIWLLKTYLKP